tara:strand:- start:1785 stop:2519 length:735 start_codon:yes stop_codon:yes gene_type:complete
MDLKKQLIFLNNLKMKKLEFIVIIFLINSCSYPEMIRNELIYSNDFESNNLLNIDGGEISSYNNTNVIGDFNNDGFTIFLENIGDNDYIFVSFDLYIHGSWDGNFNGFSDNDKPDKWIMEFNPDMNLFKDGSADTFITTFSNSPCWPNYCLRQSYPESYPFENNPTKGSFSTNLEKKCVNNFFGGPTTLYKIEKGFKNSSENIVLRFYDELYQPNAIDKDGIPQSKCDESWSLDNLKIRAIKYQ